MPKVTSPPTPSRLALWLLERSLTPEEREPIVGDVVEEFESLALDDPRAARRWIWMQTWRSLVPNLRRRLSTPRTTPGPIPAEGRRMFHGLGTDVWFALRLFRRQPLTTAVAFVSLSAGLGLNVLLMSLGDAALFRSLPLRAPDRLVLLLTQRESNLNHNFSYPDYRDLRDAQTIESLVAYSSVDATAAGAQGAMPVTGEVVSGNFFEGLGVPLRTGRPLTELDDRADAAPAAVISEAFWRDRLGSPSLSNLTVSLNGRPFTVVGIAAVRFSGMQVGRSTSVWVPIAHATAFTGDDLLGRRTASWLTIVGRLAPGTAMEPARLELDATLRRLFESSARSFEPLVLRPGGRGDSVLSEMLASPMQLLLIAGVLVLLVACLNVANLQLARAEARRSELAVRAALGARRIQLIRLIVVDALLMSIAAGVAGLFLAFLASHRAALLIATYGQPVTLHLPLDFRLAAVALFLSLAAAFVIGGLSTWQIVRRRPAGPPMEWRGATGSRRATERGLVMAQIALSMALLTGASLLVRTLDLLRQTDLGIDARRVALLEVSPEMGRLKRPAALAYFGDALRAVASVPGVEAAAVAHVMPLAFGGSRTSIAIAGYTPRENEDLEINFIRVTPGYFKTVGVPIRGGRDFDQRDTDGQPQRIIVNEAMARRFWPDGRAVGGFVRFSSQDPFDVEVIGVVSNAHYRMVREEPTPSFYVPLAQWPTDAGVLHVRTTGDPAARLDDLRQVVAAINPAVPVVRAHTLLDQRERNIADERMAMAIGLTLAVVALLLATGGLYATMSFFVGRRTREIGVRMALGARSADVRALVLREGVLLTAAGVVLGLALSAWVGQALQNQLYGVGSFDPMSLLAAAAILSAAALLAAWLPARRAASVDPIVALREP